MPSILYMHTKNTHESSSRRPQTLSEVLKKMEALLRNVFWKQKYEMLFVRYSFSILGLLFQFYSFKRRVNTIRMYSCSMCYVTVADRHWNFLSLLSGELQTMLHTICLEGRVFMLGIATLERQRRNTAFSRSALTKYSKAWRSRWMNRSPIPCPRRLRRPSSVSTASRRKFRCVSSPVTTRSLASVRD